MLWEELYKASSPDTKVILTIRDDEDAWWKSLTGQMKIEAPKYSVMARVQIENIMQ